MNKPCYVTLLGFYPANDAWKLERLEGDLRRFVAGSPGYESAMSRYMDLIRQIAERVRNYENQ